MDSLETIGEKIKDADMVLLGIGEELRINREDVLGKNPVYAAFSGDIKSLEAAESDFIKNSLYTYELEKRDNIFILEKLKTYNQLRKLVQDKNYFAVTTCSDDVICFSDFDSSRIVRPCGTGMLMKCHAGCCDEVLGTKEIFGEINEKLFHMYQNGRFVYDDIKQALPKCKECGADMEIYAAGTAGYSEKGYQEDWRHYTMWLQGTLNRKLCILELGVSFAYPTVIRWPFERIAALNNKACFVRVNGKLPQVAKEIKEKSFSVEMNSNDFISELTK